MYDIAVIGGGVVGGLIARRLCAYDLKICIAEKENDVAMGASKANSAIVHAGFDAKEGTLKAQLNVRGSLLMPQVAKELGVKYKNNGSLVIGFSEEDRAMLETLLARGQKNGVPGLRILEKEELAQKEPNLSDQVLCALYAPTGAIICPYELTIAAIGNAMDNGATLVRNFKVEKIEEKDGFYELSSGTQSIKARLVINAAGVYSDAIAAMVGDESFSIRPRRGEYLLLDKTAGSLLSATVFRTPGAKGKGILVTPTVDGNLLLGPTATDIDDKDDVSVTEEGTQKVLKEAAENVKALPRGKVITTFCGLRATGSTGDFIIRRLKKGFIHVAGIESPGLSASPAIAEYVEALVKEEMPLVKKAHYNPYRKAMHAFRDASIEEKNEMIRKNPTYGTIVCRCETVTEGEILDAIAMNPKPYDIDGVKRRTRAQMGRCQGGFCGPRIVELLAQAMGVEETQITKSGKGSYLLTRRTKEEEA